MSNFFSDNPALKHHLHHPLMKRIVELKERNYTDATAYDYAPVDFEDAMDSYEKVLEIAGETMSLKNGPDWALWRNPSICPKRLTVLPIMWLPAM